MSEIAILFEVKGAAVGKGRPRSTRTGRVYTPPKTVAYEKTVAAAARAAMAGRRPHHGGASVSIVIVVTPPSSWRKAERKTAIDERWPAIHRTDIDNVAKSILDGMNGVIFVDDKQVCFLRIVRFYGNEPKVSVQVFCFDDRDRFAATAALRCLTT